MPSTIFEPRPLVARSWLQRLLGQHPPQNAVIELNNLLASRPIEAIMASDLAALEARYSLSLQQFQLNLEEFYAVHLHHRLTNPEIRLDELGDLVHLQTLLGLPASCLDRLHNQIGEDIYKKRVEGAVSQGSIAPADKVALYDLRQWLSLPIEVTDQIYQNACQTCLARFVQTFGAKARLKPEDGQQLQLIARQLGVKPSIAIRSTVERYQRYWEIECMPLPVIAVAIPLQKSEQCYFQTGSIEWWEERATVRHTTYEEHYEQYQSFEVVDLTSNDVSPQKDTFPILKRIHTGSVYLTNKRLLFEGQEKTTTIKFEAITAVKPYQQGVLLQKTTGKDVLLRMRHGADELTLVYQKLLRLSSHASS